MSAAYTPLPTANGHGYPSNQSNAKALLARLTPAAPPTRIRRLLAFLAVLALSSTLVVYLVFSPSFSFGGESSASPGSNYDYSTNNGYDGGTYGSNEGGNGGGGGGVGPDGPASPFFRDAHPALHARLFLARAQAEIRERGLDTCGGQLGSKMVDTYMKNKVEYCKPSGGSHSRITCFPAGIASPRGTSNSWWPYAQAFCASSSLSHTPGWGGPLPGRGVFTGQCRVGDEGAKLKGDMGRENFLGTEFSEDGYTGKCEETISHPVLFVPRQDRWNPFHVGEDLVTTFWRSRSSRASRPPPPPLRPPRQRRITFGRRCRPLTLPPRARVKQAEAEERNSTRWQAIWQRSCRTRRTCSSSSRTTISRRSPFLRRCMIGLGRSRHGGWARMGWATPASPPPRPSTPSAPAPRSLAPRASGGSTAARASSCGARGCG
ncbi:hypothetical protein B0H13DRAFT_308166 [Mycena leptocephala]|nr:hypothetical protein B0H13DRAFT_308166 [Mycena leptocephala]